MLRRLLEAVVPQLAPDGELIVVDDGSEDGSAEEVLAVAAAGHPVRLVRGSGEGAVAARRLGVEVAGGKILGFTDSDCVPAPGWIAAGVAAIGRGADVVQGVTTPARPPGPLERSMWVQREDGLYATCNVFYRRDAFDAAGGFDATAEVRLGFRHGRRARGLGFGEDTLLAWRVRRRGRAEFEPEAKVVHEVHPPDLRESISRAWMAGAFPALVREVPELRRTLLWSGLFLGRSRLPLYGSMLAASLRRRHVARGLCAWWVLHHAHGAWSQERLPARLPRVLLMRLGLDALVGVALAWGSLRAGIVVL